MNSRCHSPLHDDLVGPLQVSKHELTHLRAKAECAVQHALDQFQTPRTRRSSRAATRADVMAPNKSMPSRSTSQAVCTVNGSYSDLLEHFSSKTHEEYFNIHKTMFPFAKDARVLYENAADESDHHEAITWAAYELFPLQTHADTCQYEATGHGVDPYGRPYAFHVVIPAGYAEVPVRFQSERTVRILSAQVTIARPNKASNVLSDVFFSMRTDFRSSQVHRALSTRFCANLPTVAALLSSALTPISPWVLNCSTWIQPTPPSCCASCLRAFTMLRGRHNCVVCSRSVCRKCAVKATTVLDPSLKKSRGRDPNTSRSLCAPCVALLCEDTADTPTTESLQRPTVDNRRKESSRRSSTAGADVASLPFVESPAPEKSTEPLPPPALAPLSARDDVSVPQARATRAKSTSGVSRSLAPRKRGGLFGRAALGRVPLSPVEEETSCPPSPSVRLSGAASTQTHDGFHWIRTGLHAQAPPLTRFHRTVQRHRRTQ